jgi:glycosyltransferase involved in cell wall biosynthesis
MALTVLHISESDAAGGAGAAAYRLHRQLQQLGHRSRMLVGRRVTDDPGVRALKRGAGWRAADRASGEVLDRAGLQYAFYPSSFGVVRDPWFREADVVQLHNLHGSYFSFSALPVLSRRRPLVWQLHDQWAMTGHVAYPLDCERWRTGCGECPYLGEYPRLRRDTTARLWRLKDRAYARSRIVLVVPTRWLERLVGESPLLRRFEARRIPTGIDADTFRPGSRDEARTRLGLPGDRRLVLFAATQLWERRKGLELLVQALAALEDPPLLVLAGEGDAPLGVESRALGSVGEAELVAAYRAADVVAVPTLADVQTQTAPEALGCATPVVSFDEGGVVDVVRHLETGWQARFGDADDLGRGLATLLADDELRARLGRQGRELVEREYGAELQATRYAALYAELKPGSDPDYRPEGTRLVHQVRDDSST